MHIYIYIYIFEHSNTRSFQGFQGPKACPAPWLHYFITFWPQKLGSLGKILDPHLSSVERTLNLWISLWIVSSNPTGSNFLLLDIYRYYVGKPLMLILPIFMFVKTAIGMLQNTYIPTSLYNLAVIQPLTSWCHLLSHCTFVTNKPTLVMGGI